MNKATEEKAIQTIAAVASLAGLSLKKATTGDDLKEFTLTLAFIGVSAGVRQEHFEFEREDTRMVAKIDGTNGHVDSLQIGDRAETGEEADAEINAAAAAALTEELNARETLPAGNETEKVGEATVVDTTPIDQVDEGKPDIHLVGEAAALGKKRR